MRLLVDTNVFIDYWKNPSDDVAEVFQKNEIAVCGVVETELLRGANSENHFDQIKKALECFEFLSFEDDDWLELAKLFNKLKSAGLSVPFQDGIIAYLARKWSCAVWSQDKHFKMIQMLFPDLQLWAVEQ